MANNKEEAGKGTPRPGETPGGKRTYATIDGTASEVESPGRIKDKPPPAAASGACAGGVRLGGAVGVGAPAARAVEIFGSAARNRVCGLGRDGADTVATVKEGASLKCWWTMPIPAAIACPGPLNSTGCPRSRIEPESRGSSP